MKKNVLISFTVLLIATFCNQNNPNSSICSYYTRLSFDDNDFTGKYADVIVDLSEKGQFIFSREYSYQPYWLPKGGNRSLVDRLIPRVGDGTSERPDKNNISSNAAIVQKTATSVTVHWRYAPDLTKLSFVEFRDAYNKAGNPSEFYAEYVDEYFTIHADGTVIREVKKGCYRLDEWNDHENQFTQKLKLTSRGIVQKSIATPKMQKLTKVAFQGEVVKKSPLVSVILNFTFDEALSYNQQQTTEVISKTACPIEGVAAYWRKGVSGTCLSFDSYSNAVVLPSSKCPSITDEFTIEAWVAPQEYPFNLAAIVDHLNGNDGYFLGINAKGEIVLKAAVNSELTELASKPVPLYKWTHVTATYQKSTGLSIYCNAVLSIIKPTSGNLKDAANTDFTIGMTRSHTQSPVGAERDVTKSFKTNMVFSGLIDEVKIYRQGLSQDEVKLQYEAFKPDNEQPLQPWVLPAGPETSSGFGAIYTNLKYSPEWDGLWRVGNYSDIVVTFKDEPWRFVFWRGTRYLPSLVTDYGRSGIWSSDQSPEHFNGQCYEHMSDMLCRFSNARLISSTPARVIVHWRNSSGSIDYKWPGVDENGWGIWTDEYWTIYPDGVSIRHQIVHNNTSARINCEMNQNEILHQPGQTTNDVLLDGAVIIGNTKGETQTVFRSKKETSSSLNGDKNLQFTNLNSSTKQFEIGEIGSWVQTFLHNDTYWMGWNHYPVQLIPSDGTDINKYDRPSSTCPTTLHEVRRTIDKKTMEAMVIYGLTNDSPESLTNLNLSWNYAPEVIDVTGAQFIGYEKRERAYKFSSLNDAMNFKIQATKRSPIENLALVIKNWRSSDTNISLIVNDEIKIRGTDFTAGIEVDPDGSYVLVVWIYYSSIETTYFEIR